MEGREYLLDARAAIVCRDVSQAIGDIFFDGEMRKEGEALKNVRDSAILRWKRNAFGAAIEQYVVAKTDSTFVGGGEASDAVEQRRLPRAGWAKEDGEASGELQIDIEEKWRRVGGAIFLANFRDEGHRAGHGDQTRRFTP